MPTAEEVADSLGLSLERRKYLSELASTAKRQSRRVKPDAARTAGRARAGRKSSEKKAA